MHLLHILLTGGAGFIGSHLSEKLLTLGHKVTVIDNFDNFYPTHIKKDNLKDSLKSPNFKFIEIDIRENRIINENLNDHYDAIIHLAAKAGVQPSLKSPSEYIETNIMGTQNLLEFAKNRGIRKFIFGSSSSVYGVNRNVPWKEDDNVLNPISPYAATKVSGELLGQVYSFLYDIHFIGLRFFTVYGPRQRPDLAIHKFTKMILDESPIPFYGDGHSKRDYTYIEDIIKGIIGALGYNNSKYEIINLGNNNPVTLLELLHTIENVVNKKAKINRLPDQIGDVPITFANIEKAQELIGYQPEMNLKDGINSFYEWYKTVHKV